MTEANLENKNFWMDHIVAGIGGHDGDHLYQDIESLPTVGSNIQGFYKTDEGSKPYIFRVIGVCFYEVEATALRNSKAIGAILIDPVTENLA